MNRREQRTFAAMECRLSALDPELDSTLRAGYPTFRQRTYAWRLIAVAGVLLLLSLIAGYGTGVALGVLCVIGACLYLRYMGRGWMAP